MTAQGPSSPRVEVTRVADVALSWGESLRWDDQRSRLYFVDCARQRLHWLDDGEEEPVSMDTGSLPTGVALTDDGRLVVALDDGLHVVDPDSRSSSLLAAYPDDLGGRANDMTADLDGNLVTGTLGLSPGPGSYWWYSASEGWRQLDDGIGNANGPAVLHVDDQPTLLFADTPAAAIYAYRYDGASGTVGPRRTFADVTALGGMPDGACLDSAGGLWSCVLGRGALVRLTGDGPTGVVACGVELPSDATFGGPGLDRLYFVSIAVPLPGVEITSPDAGRLMVVDGTGSTGVPERRFSLR